MIKGAYIGGSGACLSGPAAFSGGDFRITAFCPSGAGAAAPAAPADRRSYADAAALLLTEQDLEFAAVSLPPGESFRAVQLSLERGLHVICEPPFCSSTTEFETLREAAERKKRIIFPVQPWEHAGPWRALEKAITRGLAGEINFAEVQALLPGPPPDGGATAGPGWQAFSMLLAMMRRPPSAIEARLDAGTAAFHAHFGGGDGFVHISFGAAAPRLRAAVSGVNGRLEMDGNLLRLDVKDLPRETVELRHELVPGLCRPEWLAAELSDFRKEMNGEMPRGSGLRNSRYCVKLLKNASYSASVKSAAIPL